MSEAARRKVIKDGETAQEAYSRIVYAGKRCSGCGMARPAICIRSVAKVSDILKHRPDMYGAALAQGRRPFMSKEGEIIYIAEIFACRQCAKDAIRAASKHPSWMHCEINTGPKPDKIQIQVPRK